MTLAYLLYLHWLQDKSCSYESAARAVGCEVRYAQAFFEQYFRRRDGRWCMR